MLFTFSIFAQNYESGVKITTPSENFKINGNGTINDKKTGLMWKVASEGQTWSGGKVSGACEIFTWRKAMKRVEAVNSGSVGDNCGYNDWRVPTVEELATIVEKAAYGPSINLEIFPGTPSSYYWSSTAESNFSSDAQGVDFYGGGSKFYSKENNHFLRLVRLGK